MGTRLRLVSIAAAALAGASFASAAQADYFIRPYVSQGYGVVDGLDVNGATEGEAHFTDNFQSSVDLATGTVHEYLQITGPDSGGSGFGQAAGIFGDRITFDAAQGDTIDFSFAFDGTIVSPARVVPDSTMQIGVIANLRVFDPGAGATYANFASLDGALVSDTAFLDFSNPAEALNEYVSDALSGSLTLAGGRTFDVFASLSIFASLNENPVTVTMDFLHTGTFGIAAPDGVSFTSDSGVFLGSGSNTAAVPEPATWATLIAGFGLVGASMRRRTSLRMQAV